MTKRPLLAAAQPVVVQFSLRLNICVAQPPRLCILRTGEGACPTRFSTTTTILYQLNHYCPAAPGTTVRDESDKLFGPNPHVESTCEAA